MRPSPHHQSRPHSSHTDPALVEKMLRRVGGVLPRLAACARPAPSTLVRCRKLCTTTSAPTPTPAEKGLVGSIASQVTAEVANANSSPAALYGFIGACCNWFLGLSAAYDASIKGPEVISLQMTCVMICYSSLFARWGGWAVMPRNYVLAGSHIFNVVMQANQLRRALEYKLANGGEEAKKEIIDMATKAATGAAAIGALVMAGPSIQRVVAPIGPAYLSSPGGPFTIHPWPPMTKLMISGVSLLEFDRPTDKISLSQYSAVCLSGFEPAPCAANAASVSPSHLSCVLMTAHPDWRHLLQIRTGRQPDQLPAHLCERAPLRKLCVAPRTEDQGRLHVRETCIHTARGYA